ncbi:MAG: flagellar biosynthesis protein FlhB [Eubacterium sp.]|nr:flagellar biosynthesis protein FlhB [Eubacterium sp.]
MIFEYNLQFFAKDGEGGEKTEPATPKKLEKAREEGQAPRSQDMNTAVILLVLFGGVKIFGGFMFDRIEAMYQFYYNSIADYATEDLTIQRAMGLFSFGLKEILIIILPLVFFAVIGVFVSGVVQVKWKVTLKPMMPKLSKINPINGFKRLFSKDKLFDLLKAIVKVGVLFYVAYSSLKDEWGLVVNIYQLDVVSALVLIVDTVLDIALKICAVFFILAFADWAYQKHKFKTDMKMTKQEVKDEYKNTEGNPQIKGQIRRKMQEASRRRMMQELPEADVVITNPTHLAVALKYDKEKAEAPVVIAKGADYLANRIKEIAAENRIEIVENKPLARMLYYNVEIGDQIPPELYQMVAEILAYVYGLQGKVS